jgi:hypothetical protein
MHLRPAYLPQNVDAHFRCKPTAPLFHMYCVTLDEAPSATTCDLQAFVQDFVRVSDLFSPKAAYVVRPTGEASRNLGLSFQSGRRSVQPSQKLCSRQPIEALVRVTALV